MPAAQPKMEKAVLPSFERATVRLQAVVEIKPSDHLPLFPLWEECQGAGLFAKEAREG